MKINRFEDLHCWKSARELCKYVYQLTKKSRFSKDFKHVEQINASSGSTMDNIAEGFGRRGNKEFSYFLHVSLGSAYEVKSQLYRALDKEYIEKDEFQDGMNLADNTAGKIYSLITHIEKSDYRGAKFK